MKTNRQIKYLIAVVAAIIIIAILGYITVSVNRSNGNPGNDSAADTKSNISGKQTDDLNKQVESFTLGDDLRTAITELAGSDEHLDKKSVTVDEKHWKEQFISDFIQNSRLSFSYLDKISKENDGMVSVKELNYMQSSLTGVELDFSDVVDKTVDIKQASDNLSSGTLSGYKYEPVENGAVITGILDTGIKNEDEGPWSGRRKVKVYLVKNPESCFDAFTISSLSSINIEN